MTDGAAAPQESGTGYLTTQRGFRVDHTDDSLTVGENITPFDPTLAWMCLERGALPLKRVSS